MSSKPPRLKVQVWIHGKDAAGQWRVLILKVTPTRGDFWQPVTGHVEKGESVENAALREATEETGLAFRAPLESLNRAYTFESRGETVEEHVFALEAPGGIPAVRMDPHEHVEYRWVSPGEAMKLVRFKENAAMLELLWKRQKS